MKYVLVLSNSESFLHFSVDNWLIYQLSPVLTKKNTHVIIGSGVHTTQCGNLEALALIWVSKAISLPGIDDRDPQS